MTDMTKYFQWSEYIRTLGPDAFFVMMVAGTLFVLALIGMRQEWKK